MRRQSLCNICLTFDPNIIQKEWKQTKQYSEYHWVQSCLSSLAIPGEKGMNFVRKTLKIWRLSCVRDQSLRCLTGQSRIWKANKKLRMCIDCFVRAKAPTRNVKGYAKTYRHDWMRQFLCWELKLSSLYEVVNSRKHRQAPDVNDSVLFCRFN